MSESDKGQEPGKDRKPEQGSEHHTLHDEGAAARAKLASGLLVLKNAAISMGAAVLITIMAVIAVPILIDRLGAAKFGIISLAWVIIGYASMLDLGLGRALMKLTADRLGAGKRHEIPGLFWMSLALLAAIGTVTGALIAGLSGWLTHDVLAIGPNLQGQAQTTFILLGCTVPFLLTCTALEGNLDAHQRFDLTNGIGVPLSFISYFGPVAISFFTSSLPLVVSAVCISRVLATMIYFVLCLREDRQLREHRRVDPTRIVPLLRFGGWVTVAAVATGVMLSLDRLLIGARVSAAAVAYYATPYEASKQILFVAGAFSSVLFPGFAANVGHEKDRAERLFSQGVRASFVGLFPLALIASVLSYEILEVWINSEFAEHGGPILQLLPVGVLINGLAFVAFALVQSARPAVVATLACVELPLYLGGLWVLLKLDGIEGAAIAFTVRVAFDTTALYILTRRLDLVSTHTLLAIGRMAVIGVVAIVLGWLVPSTLGRIAYVLIILACFAPLAWFRILTDGERDRLARKLASFRRSVRGGTPDSAAGAA
jgi:O-antigen/teichoic acid export membrane protein